MLVELTKEGISPPYFDWWLVRTFTECCKWAKRPICWSRFEGKPFTLNLEFANELVSESEINRDQSQAIKAQKEINKDYAMIEFCKIKNSVWINLQKLE